MAEFPRIQLHVYLPGALKNRTLRASTSISRMSSFYKEPNWRHVQNQHIYCVFYFLFVLIG